MAEELSEGTALNRRWRTALMAYFMRRVRSYAEAEDLTQEVFLRILRRSSSDRAGDTYIFQIAQNLLADRARRTKVRESFRLETLKDTARGVDWLDPHEILTSREKLVRLTAALAELPERTRTIYILYKLERMSQDAIAENYGISTSAVKQQVAKAVAYLAARMRDEA